MKYTGFVLIAFGITNIIFPDIIAYLLGGFCVILWVSMLLGSSIGPKKPNGENYVKVGDYKIFR